MALSIDHRPALESVGRRGAFWCEFARDGHRTVLADSFCSTPWHQVPPSYLDDSGCASQWLVNPSGGLVGGDELRVRAQLGAHAHVLITTPSANRIYRSSGDVARQRVEVTLGPGAILEWFPDLTIPFAGARYDQSIHVSLDPAATVVLWDGLASGRVAAGERWRLSRLDNEIRIDLASGASVVERATIEPGASGLTDRLMGSWDYVGSLFVIGETVVGHQKTRLEQRLAELLDAQPGNLLGSVSEPAAPGLVVKVVAQSAPVLSDFLELAWDAIRNELWQLSAPPLRKY